MNKHTSKFQITESANRTTIGSYNKLNKFFGFHKAQKLKVKIGKIVRTTFEVKSNSIAMDSSASHTIRSRTRRGEIRRESRNNSGDKRPKLFGRQKLFNFFHKF